MSSIWATRPHPLLFQLPPHSPPLSFKTFSSTTPTATTTTTNNYNHLIQTLCRRGSLKQALQLLPHEQSPTQKTYESLILACTQSNDRPSAHVVHRRLVNDGLDQDPFLSTKLICMYSHFSSLDNARNVFDKTLEKTIFVWNALLRALALADEGEEALSLCRDMGRLGMVLDSFTYAYALKACVASSSCHLLANERIREIHGHALRHGFDSRVHVATTLIDCYGKLGGVHYSRRVFERVVERNVVTWSAMVACYANESPVDALKLFWEMMVRDPDTVPNSVTVVSVLRACAGLAALGQGKILHAFVLRRGLDSIVSVINALIAMYVKSGSLEKGRRVFDTMDDRRDVVSWNSLIAGYGSHGFGREALLLFEKMVSNGVKPSPITFVSILGACSHSGLVDEGKRLFAAMSRIYGTQPRVEHYACMVDLLGRAGQLDEAAKVVEGMRLEPGPTVWGSLLGACRIHGHVELAERACAHLFELEPSNAGNYILLVDIYAEAKMWNKVGSIKQLLEAKGLQKVAGCSWIEVKKKLYSFVSADEVNPQAEQLHALLVKLVTQMKEIGYVPNSKVVLYDLHQMEKEQILLGHSEKLALAFGLINSGNREVIRITKNLRLCEDCHTFTKYISKLANREIFVRDVNRFHHFRDGVCSCLDYW